jgi:cysteine desulfurase
MEYAYFDHNATTPVDERVLDAMAPYLAGRFGNASSRHDLGTQARRAVDLAREQVAALVSVRPVQVVFCSGGTEANNLFVLGAAACLKPSQVAVSAIEHPCVAKPAQELGRRGWKVRKLAVSREGAIEPADVASALAEPTGIVSVMSVNNETGVIQDVGAVSRLARERGALMHTDAVQALGKIPLDFQALGVHAMTLSAHKIYGPKGAGALIVDKRLQLRPILHGGGHEQGLRSGTENVAAIVGFGAACALAAERIGDLAPRLENLRQRLERGLVNMGAVIFGSRARRVCNTTYFAFKGILGETLVIDLDKAGYGVAPGAACSSANPEPSATLLAMGVDPELALCAVRFSLGTGNTEAQVEGFLAALKATVGRLKGMTAMAV